MLILDHSATVQVVSIRMSQFRHTLGWLKTWLNPWWNLSVFTRVDSVNFSHSTHWTTKRSFPFPLHASPRLSKKKQIILRTITRALQTPTWDYESFFAVLDQRVRQDKEGIQLTRISQIWGILLLLKKVDGSSSVHSTNNSKEFENKLPSKYVEHVELSLSEQEMFLVGKGSLEIHLNRVFEAKKKLKLSSKTFH